MSTTLDHIVEQFARSAQLKKEFGQNNADAILKTAQWMIDSVSTGGKLLICGNGGSAADAQHFAAEMIGRLRRDRDPIGAIPLTTDWSNLTMCSGVRCSRSVRKRTSSSASVLPAIR